MSFMDSAFCKVSGFFLTPLFPAVPLTLESAFVTRLSIAVFNFFFAL